MARRLDELRRLRVLLVVLAPIALVLAYFTWVYLPRQRESLHARNQRSLAALATRIEGQLSNLPQIVRSSLIPINGELCPDPAGFLRAFPGVQPPRLETTEHCPFAEPEADQAHVASQKPGHLTIQLDTSGGAASFDVDLRRALEETARRFSIFDAIAVMNGNDNLELLYPEGAPMVTDPSLLMDATNPGANDAADEHGERHRTPGQAQVGPLVYWTYTQLMASGAALADEPKPWKLVGLISQDSFEDRMERVPLGAVTIVVGLMALALLLAPLLKLNFAGSRECLTQHDSHAALMALLFAVSASTLCVGAISIRSRLTHRAERSVEGAAVRLADGVWDELNCWNRAVRSFGRGGTATKDCERRSVPSTLSRSGLPRLGSSLGEAPRPRNDAAPMYVLIGRNGMLQKCSEPGAEATVCRLLDVRDRSYFREAQAGLSNTKFCDNVGCAHLDVVRSRLHDFSRGLLTVALPRPDTVRPEVSLAQVGFRPSDFPSRRRLAQGAERWGEQSIGTARSPGAGFTERNWGLDRMIVDRDGLVQFHSNPDRELQENLFVEASSRELRLAISKARALTSRVVRYHGTPHVVAVQPIHGTPWSAVVLGNNQVIAAAGVLALDRGVQGTLLLLAALALTGVVMLFAGGAGNGAGWLWPRSGAFPFYVAAAGASAAVGLDLGWTLDAGAGWCVFALPVLCFLGTFLIVASERVTFVPRALVWGGGLCLQLVPPLSFSPGTGRFLSLAVWFAIGFWTFWRPGRQWFRQRNLGAPRNSLGQPEVAQSTHATSNFPPGIPPGIKDAVVLKHPDVAAYWGLGLVLLCSAVALPTHLILQDSLSTYSRNFPEWLADPDPNGGHVPVPAHRLVPRDTPFVAQLDPGTTMAPDAVARKVHEPAGPKPLSPRWMRDGVQDIKDAAFVVLLPVLLTAALILWAVHSLVTRLFGAPHIFIDRQRARLRELGTQEAVERGNVLHVGYGAPSRAVLDALDGDVGCVRHDGFSVQRSLSFDRSASMIVVTNLQACLWDPSPRDEILESLERALARGAEIRVFCECEPLSYLREEHRWAAVTEELGDLPQVPAPTAGVSSLLLRRWGRVIARCRYCVADRDLTLELQDKLGVRTALRDWLLQECGWSSELHGVAEDIYSVRFTKAAREWTRADVVTLVERRASRIFQGILDGCTRAERLVLMRIALEGFINPRLWRCVLFLEARGLVERDDGLRLRSDALRQYLRGNVEQGDLASLERGNGGLWSMVRAPVVVVTGAALTVLFLVAPDVGTLVVAGLTPVIAGLSGARALLGSLGTGRLSG